MMRSRGYFYLICITLLVYHTPEITAKTAGQSAGAVKGNKNEREAELALPSKVRKLLKKRYHNNNYMEVVWVSLKVTHK